jgi:uncharacterized protein
MSLLAGFLALDLVVVRGQTASVLFCPERFVLMRLSDEGLVAAELALSPECSDALVESSGIGEFLRIAVDYVSQSEKVEIFDARLMPFEGAKERLPKLVLMVNNYCNLRCKYCYEHATAFQDPAACISRTAIRATIDKCYENFSDIGTILFLGGEPTLSEAAIEEGCVYSLSQAMRLGRSKPGFGMITNGMRISEHLEEVIETYGIQLTFSMDGPKATNDLVRIRHDGSGSHDAVAVNIKRFVAKYPDTTSIESTVTRAQTDSGLSVPGLLNYLANEFGVAEPHIAIAALPAGHALLPGDRGAAMDSEFVEAVELSVTNLLGGERTGVGTRGRARLSYAADLLRALSGKLASDAMCAAGNSQLVVDSHGDVFPCWMFAGDSAFRMGNILEDSLENILRSEVVTRIRANTKLTNETCVACYARFVCHACIGNNRISSGSIAEMDPRFCERTRHSLSAVLVAISNAQADRCSTV